jgi:hypothetical protein
MGGERSWRQECALTSSSRRRPRFARPRLNCGVRTHVKTLAAVLSSAILLAALGCTPAPEPFVIELHPDGFVVDGARGNDVAELLKDKGLTDRSTVVVRADAEVDTSLILAALKELDRLGVRNRWIEKVESPK